MARGPHPPLGWAGPFRHEEALVRAVRRLVTYRLAGGWPGLVALVLLVGLAGGAVLTAAAGARRTASAYPRFLVASRASDVLVGPAGTGLGGYDDALAGLPGVAAIAPIVGLQAEPVGPGGKLDQQAVVSAPLDGRFGHLLEIPKLLAGRQPQPGPPRRGDGRPDRRAGPAPSGRQQARPGRGRRIGRSGTSAGCPSAWSASWWTAARSFPSPPWTRLRSSSGQQRAVPRARPPLRRHSTGPT